MCVDSGSNDFTKNPLAELEQVSYCVDEQDEATGVRGAFAYDVYLFSLLGRRFALSTVYATKEELLDAMFVAGFKYECVFRPGWLGRRPC